MRPDRLTLSRGEGALIAGAGMVSLLATYWDDAWHTDLGRDSARIPPHLLLYGSVAVAGLVVAGWGLRALARTRSVADVLRQRSLLLAAAGGLVTLAAAPIDAAWHAAYGRDAVLWSPPHMLVVFASSTMIVGVLSGLRPARSGVVEAALAGLLLGSLAVSVMEYESDVPQFSEVFYLPVLLAAAVPAAFAARRLVPVRAPVTAMVATYVLLRLVAIAVLAALGRSTPDLPVAIAGLCLIDLPWRSELVRYCAGLTMTGALAWMAAVAGVTRQAPAAIATVAAPLAVLFALVLLAGSRRGRPLAFAVFAAAVSVGVLLGSARPAAAHDPGQGVPLARADLVGTSDGHGALTLALDLPGGCDQTTPQELVARRAGRTISGPLVAAGGCRYAGSLRVPTGGRWFVYAELRRGGQDAEVWLPMEADEPERQSATRELYAPARVGRATRAVEIGTGAAIYALGLALLTLAARQVLRTPRPAVPGTAT